MSILEIEVGQLRARAVEFSSTEIVVILADDRRIVSPLNWYPKLANASRNQLLNYQIMPMGIHWPDIDEDLSIAGMLKGIRVRSDVIKELLKFANTPMAKEQREIQRRSFVFGNTALDNEYITREIVDQEAEKLSRHL